MLSKLLLKRTKSLFRTILSALALFVKPVSFITEMLHLLISLFIWVLLLFFLMLFAVVCFLTKGDNNNECPFEQTETRG